MLKNSLCISVALSIIIGNILGSDQGTERAFDSEKHSAVIARSIHNPPSPVFTLPLKLAREKFAHLKPEQQKLLHEIYKHDDDNPISLWTISSPQFPVTRLRQSLRIDFTKEQKEAIIVAYKIMDHTSPAWRERLNGYMNQCLAACCKRLLTKSH